MSTQQATTQQPLLQAIDLKKHYPVKKGMFAPERLVKALDGVSFNLERGKTLAVVGESGCGKSTLGRLLTMIETPTGGELYYQGQDLLKHDPQAQKLRRQKIQIVFQNPYGSLNPRKKVGQILEEPLLINTSLSKEQRREKALSMMAKVGLRKNPSVDALAPFPIEPALIPGTDCFGYLGFGTPNHACHSGPGIDQATYLRSR